MIERKTRSRSLYQKEFGAIYTPTSIARFLTGWAIPDPAVSVLDIGTGEGIFLTEAFRRLRRLGASSEQVLSQLHGVERDTGTLERFRWKWLAATGTSIPDVRLGDFFHTEFPPVDAVIGNPPYVGRVRLRDIDNIRTRIFGKEPAPWKLGRLTDLYAYFVLYASRFLKPGGRLAVIVSGSWLDVDYGVGLKQFLLDNFAIRGVLTFEERVFRDALVKPVLLLAEKTDTAAERSESTVHFIRVRGPRKLGAAQRVLTGQVHASPNHDTVVSLCRQSTLNPELPWGIYLKAPNPYLSIRENTRLVALSALSYTRIGLQTLAKDFYILDRRRAESLSLEGAFQQPVAFSPREFSSPTIDDVNSTRYVLFYCDADKEQLEGTAALKHIIWGEEREVRVRRKETRVRGYHNRERLRKAGRRPWYNIKREVERRGRFPILLPRRAYETFVVLWNRAGLIPNEDFIEIQPHREEDLVPLLAFLNSSVAEMMFRMHASVYGGGVFNLNPGDIKEIPILDMTRLDSAERARMDEAYQAFLASEGKDRTSIDEAIGDLLNLTKEQRLQIQQAVKDLRGIAMSAKRLSQ